MGYFYKKFKLEGTLLKKMNTLRLKVEFYGTLRGLLQLTYKKIRVEERVYITLYIDT